MGTSKGYIAPSTPEWAKAKRCITAYVNSPSDTSLTNVASSYASAMQISGASIQRAATAFSAAASFLGNVSNHGFDFAVKELGCENLAQIPFDEAIDIILSILSNDSSTIDDSLIADSMAVAFEVLDSESLENLDVESMVKIMICEYAQRKFVQLFDKQIRNKCPNTTQANARIKEMQEYIYYTMNACLSEKILPTINIRDLSGSNVITDVISNGYKLMTEYYGE